MRIAITAAFKALEFKKYDVNREDFMDVMLEDVFDKLFPGSNLRQVEVVSLPEVEDLTKAMEQLKIAEPPKAEKKKPGPKPKAKKSEGPVNIEKLNPTQTKKLKQIADELKVEGDKKKLLEYLNSLSSDEFDSRKFDDHIRAFLTPVPAPEPEKKMAEVSLMSVDFNDKEYFVDVESKRVFEGAGEYDEEVGWTSYNPVGYVGMAAFKDMEMPSEDE